MTIDEAAKVLASTIAQLQAHGFAVWGWDDGSVLVALQSDLADARLVAGAPSWSES